MSFGLSRLLTPRMPWYLVHAAGGLHLVHVAGGVPEGPRPVGHGRVDVAGAELPPALRGRDEVRGQGEGSRSGRSTLERRLDASSGDCRSGAIVQVVWGTANARQLLDRGHARDVAVRVEPDLVQDRGVAHHVLLLANAVEARGPQRQVLADAVVEDAEARRARRCGAGPWRSCFPATTRSRGAAPG